MNFLLNSLNKFFVFGQKTACPPIEKGGGIFDTYPTTRENSSKSVPIILRTGKDKCK
jgi:hypothetical protein